MFEFDKTVYAEGFLKIIITAVGKDPCSLEVTVKTAAISMIKLDTQ